MIVKLFTRDGGFVHEATILPFNPPPEMIQWGERAFVRAADYDGTIDFNRHGVPTVHYTEGLLYPLIDLSEVPL